MFFEIVAASGGYRVRQVSSGNYKILFWSEVYTTKAAAWNAIDIVKTHAASAPVYDRTV